MDLVPLSDVRSAAEILRSVAHRTPVLTSTAFDTVSGRSVLFKAEHLQRAGAFKFRGAYNRISAIPPVLRRRGVAAFSSGNHAQAVALASRLFGVSCTICMPSDAPQVKVEATRGYGADVVFYDRQRDDRVAFGKRVAEDRGHTLVPPFDDRLIVAGAGTLALELLEDAPQLDALVVPVGGGGLISGCAVAAKGLRPHIRVIGVETELRRRRPPFAARGTPGGDPASWHHCRRDPYDIAGRDHLAAHPGPGRRYRGGLDVDARGHALPGAAPQAGGGADRRGGGSRGVGRQAPERRRGAAASGGGTFGGNADPAVLGMALTL